MPATLTPRPTFSLVSAFAAFGSWRFALVADRCISCHGDNFAGTKAAARIAGRREDHLLKALHDYKFGQRSGGGVAAIAEVAYPRSEEDIAALAHYLSRL